MRKTYYNAHSLRSSLDVFERRYGLSSADFHTAYVDYDEDRMSSIPRYDRFSCNAGERRMKPTT